MNKNIRTINKCRVCGEKKLLPILSLGNQHTVGFTDTPNEKTPKAPLDLVLCSNNACNLLQLKHTFNHDLLYKTYWYKSGISSTMVKELKGIVDTAMEIIPLEKNDVVIDIGANDGTLLSNYPKGVFKRGFEPSNICFPVNNRLRMQPINDFFTRQNYLRAGFMGKAKIMSCIAMFYDLDTPNDFVADIKKCLDEKGIWIIQMNYLGSMLSNNTFDNISAEHLEYYSLTSLMSLLNRHKLDVFRVELNDVNGGSFRVYVKHLENKDIKIQSNVQRLLNKEFKMRYDKKETYSKFANNIKQIKTKTLKFITSEIKKGKKFGIYGASTRGLVVLEYLGLNRKSIEYAIDKNPDKNKKYITGSKIQIFSKIAFDYLVNLTAIGVKKTNMVDYLLVLPYQFINEIKNDNLVYRKNCGKLFVCLPKLKIIK